MHNTWRNHILVFSSWLAIMTPVAAETAAVAEVSATEMLELPQPQLFVAPSITINGQIISSSSAIQKQQAAEALLPQSLKNPIFQSKLKNKTNITPHAHSPKTGRSLAPLEIIEFLDLGCGEACVDVLHRLSSLQERHPKKVRIVHNYMPQTEKINMVNFYGKIAQQEGQFWEYRKQILQTGVTQSEAALGVLIDLQIPRENIRLAARREAEKFYKELDQERLLAEKLQLKNGPHLFINGIHLGEGGIPMAQLEDVILYELMQLKQQGAKF